LIGLLLPAVQKVREAAARMRCQNNLKQLGLACLNYHDSNQRFPPGGGAVNNDNTTGYHVDVDNGSWIVYILPQIEQSNLFDQIDSAPGTGSRIQRAAAAKVIPIPLSMLRCSSDSYMPGAPIGNYGASMGPQCAPGDCTGAQSPYNIYCDGSAQYPAWGYLSSPTYGDTFDAGKARGMFTRAGAKITLNNIPDGTSNTILLGEVLGGMNGDILYSINLNGGNGLNTGWAQTDNGLTLNTTIVPINTFLHYLDPNQNRCMNALDNVDNRGIMFGFRSNHSGGANFAFVDGSVHFLHKNIDHKIYNQLGCRDDGQPASPP
jgi:prepilin-type processing-associated H-X9-DG protein